MVTRSPMYRLIPLIVIGLLSYAGSAPATPDTHHPGARAETPAPLVVAQRQKGGEISLEEAVEQVRAETGGRILSAETVQSQGRRVHRIKVLTPDRRVRVVNVDAATGRR